MTRETRRFTQVVMLSLVPVAIYGDTIATMVRLWSTDTYRHGYLIPFISLGLLWRDRATYSLVKSSGSWAGVIALLGLVLIWIVSATTSVQQVEQLCVVLMISAFVLSVLGWQLYARVWFALLFLLAAVPIGASLIPRLMDITATIAVGALHAFGVPALREGMLVFLPGGTFEVVEACSGANYLNAGVALGVLVAHVMFKSPWRQVSYVAAIIVAFLLTNGIRAFIVMFVASASHMRLLAGRDHIFFGWLLFLAAMVLMYRLAERYSDARARPTHAAR